jgi:hypothetical protein
VEISKLFRNIRSDEPRVTRFAIDWSGNAIAVPIEASSDEEVSDPTEEAADEVIDFNKMDEGDEADESEDEDEEDDANNIEVDLDHRTRHFIHQTSTNYSEQNYSPLRARFVVVCLLALQNRALNSIAHRSIL